MLDLGWGLEESVPTTLAGHLLGKALESNTVEFAGRRMHSEPWQNLLQVPAALAGTALRIGSHRDDQVGALETNRILARAEEEALDDPR